MTRSISWSGSGSRSLFVDEFVQAVRKNSKNAFLHLEDFGLANARRMLVKYQPDMCTFEPAQLMAALKIKKEKLSDERVDEWASASRVAMEKETGMRLSLSKDPGSKSGESLVHVEVSKPDEPPDFACHSFKYIIPPPSATDSTAKSKQMVKSWCYSSTRGPQKIIGAALFKALFSGYAGQLLQKIDPNDRILLQLNKHQDLDAIPWEYANAYTRFLVHQHMFARVHDRRQKLLDPLPKFPLRIVAVAPDPVIPPDEPDANLPDLHLSEQFQNFINGFTKNKKAVQLERAFPPTVSQMDALLMQRETATVLHFMGHCGQKGVDGPRALVFEHNDNGRQEYIDTSRFVRTPDNLRLAFLSACDYRDVARVWWSAAFRTPLVQTAPSRMISPAQS